MWCHLSIQYCVSSIESATLSFAGVLLVAFFFFGDAEVKPRLLCSLLWFAFLRVAYWYGKVLHRIHFFYVPSPILRRQRRKKIASQHTTAKLMLFMFFIILVSRYPGHFPFSAIDCLLFFLSPIFVSDFFILQCNLLY